MLETRNLDFLEELSQYNIDQPGAISSPNNWVKAPLLEVDHGIYKNDFVKVLVDDLLSDTDKGKWLFITGSPGNGKSAFCGKLHREIISRSTYKFEPEFNEGELPYIIHYSAKGNKYDSLRIIQDATVIAKAEIFSADPNEGRQLYENIKEAYNKGKSLVVCANNGIMQQTHEYVDSLSGDNVDSELQTIIKRVTNTLEDEFTFTIKSPEKKKVYSEITLAVKKQDIESLLLKNEDSEASPISQILNKIIDDKNWKSCSKCKFNDLCPWYLNKTDFKDVEIKDNFIKQLRRVEILLGQVLPFRSLLSIVSNFFGGIKFGNQHPCEFVNDRVQHDDFFNLLRHRFYQKFHNFGKDLLELSFIKTPEVKSKFLDSIIDLASDIEKRNTLTLLRAEQNYSKSGSISDGIFDKNGIHELLDLRYSDFSEISDISEFSLDNFAALKDYKISHLLESKIINIFRELDENLGSSYLGSDKVENFKMLREWSKDFSVPLYSFEKDQPLNKNAVDKFNQICRINHGSNDLSVMDLKRKLEKQIPEALEYLKDDTDHFFPIGNRFEVDNIGNISFKIRENPKNKLTVRLHREDDIKNPLLTIDAKKFIWFHSIYEKKLLNWSVPQETEEEIIEFKEKIGASVDLTRNESFRMRLEKTTNQGVKSKITLKKDIEDGVFVEESL